MQKAKYLVTCLGFFFVLPTASPSQQHLSYNISPNGGTCSADLLKEDVFAGRLSLDRNPASGSVVTLSLTVVPQKTLIINDIRFSIEPGLEFLDTLGVLPITLEKGKEYSYRRRLRVDSIGNKSILLYALGVSDGMPVSSSYYLYFTSTENDGRWANHPFFWDSSATTPSNIENGTKIQQKAHSEVDVASYNQTVMRPQSGLATITGKWEYTNQDITRKPIRRAKVYLVEDAFPWPTLATAYTDDNGRFSFAVSLSGCKNLYVQVDCETQTESKVTNAIGLLYNGKTQTKTVCGSIDFDTWYFPGGDRNWQALDNVVQAHRYLSLESGYSRPKVNIQWPHSNLVCVIKCPSSGFNITWPCYLPAPLGINTIFLPSDGQCAGFSNWDSSTVAHEYGHAVMDAVYGGLPGIIPLCPSAVGGHDLCLESCQDFAMTEGWAEFFAAQTYNKLEAGGCCSSFDLETNNFWYGRDCDPSNNDGSIVEGAVASILWDIYDSPNVDDDSLRLSLNNANGSIWRVFSLSKPQTVNEFWNAWFANGYGFTSEICGIYADHGVKKDVTAPSAVPNVRSPSHNPNTWSNDNTVDFLWADATDNLCGIKGYSFVMTASPTNFPTCEISFIRSTNSWTSFPLNQGNWWFHIIAMDWAENCGNKTTIGPFQIDITLPSVSNISSCSGHQPNICNATSKNKQVCMTWTGNDNLSGIRGYAVAWSDNPTTDPGDNPNVSSPPYPARLWDDTWYFHIKSVDNAGNKSQTLHYGPINIDSTFPTIANISSCDGHQPGVCSSDSTICFSWTANDNLCGIKGYSYVWDGSPTTEPDCSMENSSTSVTTGPLADGNWYFHLKAIDNAENCSPVIHSGPYKIDTKAPSLVGNLASSTHTVSNWSKNCTVQITWTASSDVGCGVDGYSRHFTAGNGTPVDCGKDQEENELSYQQCLGDGNNWYFHVKALDNAGNCGSNLYLGPFKIDTTAPSSSINSLPAVTETTSFPLCWTGTDQTPGSGIKNYDVQYRVNNGTWKNWVDSTSATCKSFGPTSPVQVLSESTYYYRSRARDTAGNIESYSATADAFTAVHIIITGVDEVKLGQIPKAYNLGQNFPNPFNPATQILFDLPISGWVSLQIFNVAGQRVRVLVDEHLNAGRKLISWDGKDDRATDMPSGIYFYQLQAFNFSDTKKMVLIR